jgi:hypothetical protein
MEADFDFALFCTLINVLPWEERRTLSRDEFYTITSYALPHQFAVPFVMSHDSPALYPQDPHTLSET